MFSLSQPLMCHLNMCHSEFVCINPHTNEQAKYFNQLMTQYMGQFLPVDILCKCVLSSPHHLLHWYSPGLYNGLTS